MDRLAVTAGFFFFLIFCSTASIALDAIDKTDNDLITEPDQSKTFPDSEPKFPATIVLPSSEKSESEPATVEKVPESYETATVQSSSEPQMESVPLTIISFRPINRRFRSPGRTMIPFRPRHPCRHHHQLVKPWGPGFRGREVSYGDDMLISGFKGVDPNPMFRGGVKQIPARWVQFHPEGTDQRTESMRWAHPRKDEKREDKEEEEEEEKHEKEHHHHHHHHEKSWFMGKVRKFLNQF